MGKSVFILGLVILCVVLFANTLTTILPGNTDSSTNIGITKLFVEAIAVMCAGLGIQKFWPAK